MGSVVEASAPSGRTRDGDVADASLGMERLEVGEISAKTTSPPETTLRSYMTGWRLYGLTFALCLGLFLSALETTIVSTSLVPMTSALNGFDQRDWVVTSYLLSYTGFMIIFSQFSDVLGRKVMVLLAFSLFSLFSIACGLASSMLLLIIFRAFQGTGASGIYALATIITPEMVPSDKWGNYVAVTSLVFVLSSVLGPLLGGVIATKSTWRWVFLLNPPAAVISIAIIAFLLPANFPHHGQGNSGGFWSTLKDAPVKRLDVVGAGLLLAASILLVFGFEEAGSRFSWASAPIIATLVAGGVSFCAFVAREWAVERPNSTKVPVFPLRLLRNRKFVGLLLIAFFTGPPFMTVLINMPQRFQIVNGLDPFQAGIRLLPMLLSSPVATAVAAQLVSKLQVPPLFVMMMGASCQMIGVGLASSVASDDVVKMMGYEVIMGFGFGTTLVTLLVYIPFVVERSDMAVSMGTLTQLRLLGGTIGLSVSATILNGFISPKLGEYLSERDIDNIFESAQSIRNMSEDTRHTIQEIFNDGYNAQFRAVLYITGAVWLSTLLLWERKPRSARDIEGY